MNENPVNFLFAIAFFVAVFIELLVARPVPKQFYLKITVKRI
jgi:hypothetical protein